MNLFVEDLTTISFADVETFLGVHSPEVQRPMEGVKLDYKLKEPAELCDTVAAFANTAGGLIFIGVESKKVKHNIPISIPGENFAGGDVKARIIGKVASQVTPRPDVQIGVVPVPASSGSVVVVIRVAESPFPPHEFSLNKRIRIPIRLQDTNQQASLRDLEHLFEKRRAMGESPDQRLSIFDETKPLLPSYVDGQTLIQPNAYQTWLVRPRLSMRSRLDRTFDREARNIVAVSFADTSLGNFFPPLMTGESHILRWQARIVNDQLGTLTAARAIEFTSNGGIRYTERLDRHESGKESVSDLVIQSMRFLKFIRQFYADKSYVGSISVAQRVDCPTPISFLSNFPDTNSQYHGTNLITFMGAQAGQTNGSSRTSIEMGIDTDDCIGIVCDFMLTHLRQLCHASVEYAGLRDLIGQLPDVPGLAFF